MLSRAAMPAHRRSFRPSAALAAALLLAAAAAFAAASMPARAAVGPQRTWQLPASTPFEPTDVAILPDGRLAIADGRSQAVLLYDRDGRRVDVIPNGWHTEKPVAVAGHPHSGEIFIAWAKYRSTPLLDPLEQPGAPSELESRTTLQSVERVPSDGAAVARFQLQHIPRPFVDLAIHPNSGHMVVHGSTPSGIDAAVLLASGIRASDAGRPRIAVWGNDDTGLTHGDGRAFEVYGVATSGQGVRTASLRKAITFTGEVPIAVGAGSEPSFHVLVRPVDGATTPGGGPIVRIVGPDLTETRAVHLEDTPAPPATEWPWAIDVGADGDYAVSTAGELFEVVRYDAAGRVRHRLFGGRPLERLDLRWQARTLDRQAIVPAVAASDLGWPVAVDRTAVGLFALRPDGDAAPLRLGAPALDIATAAGAVFTVDDRARVRRFDGAGRPDAAWSAITVPGGTRITAAGDRVFVTQPLSRTVLVLDATKGGTVARLTQPRTGAWPDDIAATADGILYAIDATRNELAVVSPSGAVSATWRVGLAAAPRFVAVADIPGGRVAVVATDEGTVERYDAATGTLVDRWQPADADGTAFVPGDIAVGPDGTVYVAQTERGGVHAYPPTPVPPATPPGAAMPTPGPLACDVRGTKGAAPRRILLGNTVDVSITLRATCPGASRFEGADILLVVDRSGSMSVEDKIRTAEAVAVRLARAFAGAPHRVGLVTFAAEAQLDAPLSAANDVAALLADVPAEGTTDVAAALALAHETLRADLRPKTVPIAVVITDGRSDTSYDGNAWATDGMLLATVAVGGDAARSKLIQASSATDLAFVASAPGAAAAIHRRLLSTIFGTVAGDWAIDDALGAQVELIEDSPRPVAARSDEMLRWARPILPPGGITFTYRVRPLATGFINTNRFAWADYTDADGARRRYILPIPVVEVIAPSPTPTLTPTPTPTPLPTATATPVPPDIYLPLALTERCRPVTSPVDAILVLDASSSMLERIADGRTKLEAARTAIGTFLDNLRWANGDRASIVAFHSAAVIAAPLTADRARLDRALAAIATDRLTCLVCGVDAAMGVLDAAGHRPDRRALIVLLTDGRSNPRPASEAVARAAAAKAAGAVIYTIGLGSDIDAEALTAIASDPKAFYRTSDAAALESIYRDIARDLPCPAGQFWGRR